LLSKCGDGCKEISMSKGVSGNCGSGQAGRKSKENPGRPSRSGGEIGGGMLSRGWPRKHGGLKLRELGVLAGGLDYHSVSSALRLLEAAAARDVQLSALLRRGEILIQKK
jgi:hypothetical protein